MKTITASIIASLVLGLVATPAFAAKRVRYNDSYMSSAPTKFYLGGSYGQASNDSSSLSGLTSNGYSVILGYEVDKNFAAEVTYVNFGSMDLSTKLGNPSGTNLLKATAYSLGVVGSLPIAEYVSIFGKLAYATTTYYYENSGVQGTSNSSGNVATAVGVNLHATKTIDLRLAYDTYKFVDATSKDMTNEALSSIGVLFKF
jgi:hypothetical protein